MGKRSTGKFERNPRDFYPTPYEAVRPLKLHIPKGSTFTEPCAGDGSLIRHLEKYGDLKCLKSFDIAPQCSNITVGDALKMTECESDFIVTNTPWKPDILHPMIEKFRVLAPTWLLLYADWMHTKQAIPYLRYCHIIISVGRVKWIADSKSTGMDNCCWYLFREDPGLTVFYSRL